MEQLQLEISELRRSMQTCMAVQAKLLNSFKQEVHPGELRKIKLLSFPDNDILSTYEQTNPKNCSTVPEATMNSIDMATKRRICCICYEMQVDSFLYR